MSSQETLLFPCAGASHCGRVAYQAAVQMTREGTGQLFCLAAIAAGIEEKLDRTRAAAIRVAIDGCDDRCARRTLERAGLPVDAHVVLTSHGIEKQLQRSALGRDVRNAVEATLAVL